MQVTDRKSDGSLGLWVKKMAHCHLCLQFNKMQKLVQHVKKLFDAEISRCQFHTKNANKSHDSHRQNLPGKSVQKCHIFIKIPQDTVVIPGTTMIPKLADVLKLIAGSAIQHTSKWKYFR